MSEEANIGSHPLDFEEYIIAGDPSKRERAYAWRTAIGLQVSDYLRQTARRNIEGEIAIDEARELVKSYYQSKRKRDPDDDEKQEADKVSSNISKIFSSPTLDFSANGFVALHRRIFEGVFKHAGRIRQFDITKKEWVLRGDTVNYLNFEDLRRALDDDVSQERVFDYQGKTIEEMVSHITKFVSGLWQIHPFEEGNTRTTAVFIIQYLRSIGFDVNNDLLAEHSWYFRNALVRANYKSAVKGVEYFPVDLERFFKNLLMGEHNELRNRYLLIDLLEEIENPTNTRQLPEQVRSLFHTDNPQIQGLVMAIGFNESSISQLMQTLGLKHRPNFFGIPSQPPR